MPTASLHQRLEGAVRTMREVVHSAEPGALSGEEAMSLIALFGEAERLAASGTALLSPKVIESGSYAKEGYASAPDWLGAVSGSSAGVAKGRLAAAERAAASPELAGALHEGHLSTAQLKIVAEITTLDPGAPGELLLLIDERASLQQLSDAAARLRAAARSKENERAQRARVHANRHFRWHQVEGGGVRGEFFCDEVEWARVATAIEADAKARWKAAGAASGEALEAHRLDAFLALMVQGARGGQRGTKTRTGARDRAIVIVDAGALRRGTTQGDELCEIDGLGPVSVEAATELIGPAGLQFVIRDGIDIRTVTGTSRVIAQRIEAALVVRDRTCVVPSCGKRLGLERDHCGVDFKDDGPTELANLARLCAQHHDMKTHGGWQLGGGPGHWSWDPPPKPPSAGRIKRTGRVAAAKSKAKATRNRPLRN